MNVEEYKKLLKQKKFDELIMSLENDFVFLYKKMLEYNNIEIPENDSLSNLGYKVYGIYPSYEDTIIEVENAINSGEYNYGEILDILLDSFNYLSKDYKKNKENEQ